MKLTIGIENFNEILNKGYSLDVIFLLKCIYENNDISALVTESTKISNLYATLKRKALISEEEDKLTTIGQELLVFTESKTLKRIPKKKIENTDFNLWWSSFPGTDTFTYKNVTFSGCRSLRQNKEECRLKFDKILLEGEYTASQLIKALEYDVLAKKEQSVKTKANKLSYMQNSLTYLNQRGYENFIELITSGNKIEESQTMLTGTDI